MKSANRFGPGILVTAAFIGPGTVTTATRAGAAFGYALLWVLLLSVIATIIFQEMAARVGLVTRQGLGEALRSSMPNALTRVFAIGLIITAIGIGNAAYQSGNIAGAAIALEALSSQPHGYWAVGVGLVAGILLWSGSYRLLEKSLIGLVVVMSVVFLITAFMAGIDFSAMTRGMVTPQLPEHSLTTAIALIGTTVVPYNLFLHASSVCEKWPQSTSTKDALRESRIDTTVAVVLGGVVTLAIMTTAAAFFATGAQPDSAAVMAQQLEPLLGRYARLFFSLGLLAAGLTSAITAPLAAAYATGGALGWQRDMRSPGFRMVWIAVLIAGTVYAAKGDKPVQAILLAQATNGLILPIVAVFLLWVINKKKLMGDHRNGVLANVLGVVVVAIIASLGVYRLVKAL